MLTIDQLNELEEWAQNTEPPEDFELPEEEELDDLLESTEGIKRLLMAYHHLPKGFKGTEYAKKLREAAYSIETVDYSAIDASSAKRYDSFTKAKMDKIMAKVDMMDFSADGFYPTRQEVDTFLLDGTEDSQAFLYWMAKQDPEELTEEERETREYAKAIIADRMQKPGIPANKRRKK